MATVRVRRAAPTVSGAGSGSLGLAELPGAPRVTSGANERIAAYDLSKEISASMKDSQRGIKLSDPDRLESILADPQEWTNFRALMQYCAYYVNYDNLLMPAIKNILIPFSCGQYRLVGGNKKIRAYYDEWLNAMHFEDLLRGMAYDYWVFGQTVCYLRENGWLQILPMMGRAFGRINPLWGWSADMSAHRWKLGRSRQ